MTRRADRSVARRRMFAVLCALGLTCVGPGGGSASADDEASDQLRAWVSASIEALGSDDETVRRSAGKVLTGLEPRDLVGVIIRHAPPISRSDSWARVASTLSRGDAPAYASALVARRGSWPEDRKRRLSGLVDVLRGTHAGSEVLVWEALGRLRHRTQFEADDSDVILMLAQGRVAVPILMEAVEACSYEGVAARAAAHVLAQILKKADVPRLGRCLRQGCGLAAYALDNPDVPSTTAELVSAVRAGAIGRPLVEVLRKRARDSVVHAAVRTFLMEETRGSVRAAGMALVAVDGEMYDLVGILADHARAASEPADYLRLAQSLARLGSPLGIEMLIALVRGFDSPVGMDTEYRCEAAKLMNWVGGQTFFTGRVEDTRIEATLAMTAKVMDLWYADVKGHIHFDRAQRRWSLDVGR